MQDLKTVDILLPEPKVQYFLFLVEGRFFQSVFLLGYIPPYSITQNIVAFQMHASWCFTLVSFLRLYLPLSLVCFIKVDILATRRASSLALFKKLF